jgi:hypothetical protein
MEAAGPCSLVDIVTCSSRTRETPVARQWLCKHIVSMATYARYNRGIVGGGVFCAVRADAL